MIEPDGSPANAAVSHWHSSDPAVVTPDLHPASPDYRPLHPDTRLPLAVSDLVFTDSIQVPTAPGIDAFVSRTRAASGIFPASPAEAVERVLAARAAYRDGILQEEAERVGVCALWMHEHNALPVRVAITEQLMPLTTLFSKLDRFGSPATMVRALRTMDWMARQVEAGDSSIGDVEVGLLTSLDHSVVFKEITDGFFVVVPQRAPGADQERLQGRHFFSNKDVKHFKGVGYRDLSIAVAKLDEILGLFRQQGGYDRAEGLKQLDASARQAGFNDRRRLADGEVTPEMERRVVDSKYRGEQRHRRADAADAFIEDFEGAVKSCGVIAGASGPRVSYSEFIARLNEALGARILPNGKFTVSFGEHLNTLPSFGVQNWPLFLTKFTESGILQPGESVLRFRVAEPGRDPEYKNLAIAELSRYRIVLADRESGQRHDLADLVERSRESLLAGGPPLLIPTAVMRYWGNYAMSSSLGLDDGMPYEKIRRVDRAMHDPDFAIRPRGLAIFPYTRLNTFTPQDLADPYDGFRPKFDALDYYEFLARA